MSDNKREINRVLITGGAGFIGRHLFLKLSNAGFRCILLDKAEEPKWFKENNSVRHCYFQEDISKWDNGFDAAGIVCADAIVHLAAEVSVVSDFSSVNQYINTNCIGLSNVLQLAKRWNVKTFLFASSGAVSVLEQNPNVYGLTKHFGENLLATYKDHAMQRHALRFSNVYGPMIKVKGIVGKLIQSGFDKNPVCINRNGKQIRDFIHVDTIVGAIQGFLDGYSELQAGLYATSLLGTGTGTSVNTLVQLLSYLDHSPVITYNSQGNPGATQAISEWCFPVSLPEYFIKDTPIELHDGLAKTIKEWIH
jgi:nucleoside-diphosphate-sugar epimerase